MRMEILSLAHPNTFGYLRILAARPDVEVWTSDPNSSQRLGEVRGREVIDSLAVTYAENLDMGVEDADAMIAAWKFAHVFLMTAYPGRFSSASMALKRAVDMGTFGELQSVMVAKNGRLPSDLVWFSDPDLVGGGTVIDYTVHIAGLLDAFMPAIGATSPCKLAYARRSHQCRGGRRGLWIEYSNATIDCGWSVLAQNPVWGGPRMQMLGTKGIADMDGFDAPQITGFSETERRPVRIDIGLNANVPMIHEFLRRSPGVAPLSLTVLKAA